MASSSSHNDPTTVSPGGAWKRMLVFVVVAAICVGIFQFREVLSLENLAKKEAELQQYRQDHPQLVYGVAFLIYVAVTGLSIPGATGMTLLLGWLLGFWRAVILVSFASTTGATLAFLISRFLLRDSIQNKFGDRLASFNRALKREGAFYLFTLRLVVAVPFVMINLVMGLTPIRTATFWWVSQLGMLPGTAVYVYAGSTVPELKALAEEGTGGVFSLQLVVAFALLGIFPIVVKKIMQRIRPEMPDSEVAERKIPTN